MFMPAIGVFPQEKHDLFAAEASSASAGIGGDGGKGRNAMMLGREAVGGGGDDDGKGRHGGVAGIGMPGHEDVGSGVGSGRSHGVREKALGGLHWSSWFDLFGTTADGCNRKIVNKAWSLLMLK